LGRQNYFPCRKETISLLRDFGVDPAQHERLLSENALGFSEPFWEMLGTRELVTIDASDFEGATRVHDMNRPIPDDLKQRFDAVCDIGTLEHVFDFPTAIRNCLEMVKPGGHFLAHTPANNNFGHGFYQFSPDLFFRILSPTNGFQLEELLAVEYGPRWLWFRVADPAAIKKRVNLVNIFPVFLLVRAKRVSSEPVLSQAPQQSDYSAQWGSGIVSSVPGAQAATTHALKRVLLEKTPRLARFLEAVFTLTSLKKALSFRNREAFERVRKKP
jgi:SAM-dependent methyltransferase